MRVEYKAGLYLAHDVANPLQFEGWGWQWRKMMNAWVTSKIAIAAKAREHCVGEAKKRVDKWLGDRAKAVEASHALDAAIDIPAPPGLAYRPYQKAGISFALARRDTLIADAMRLGKTIQGIGVANATPDLKRVLIVPPAGAKVNWMRELDKWLVHSSLSVGMVDGSNNPETDVLVINWDLLTRHREYLHHVDWDLAEFDEAHYLKNERSQRSQVVLGDLDTPREHRQGIRAKRRLFLTGTPLYTRPIDLWTLCKTCDPDGLGKKYWHFITRYCGVDPDIRPVDASGASNLEELQFKMRSSFMIRREKTDVADEIPPNRNTVVLPRSGLERIVAAEQSAVRANLGRFESLLQQTLTEEVADDILSHFAHFDGIEREEALASNDPEFIVANTDVASARRELALAKLPMCLEHLDRVLDVEPKIIIFAHHRDVVAKLREHYPDSAVVIGGLTTKKRQEQIDRFVNDPDCRVFIGNIIAAGQAINLSVADYVGFVELSWVPSEMDQAEERAWDVLKTRAVSIDRFVVEDTIDEAMCAVLDIRQRNIEKALKIKSLAA